ncbi:unnamed protein product [Acanthoscelides obtectus]|uniref:Uncharacterized protein n=1 Tax=Acanthoscelides obtectus TaxID=200917 RepID=A0A9P0P6J5_ACAOB|nr:unnamed protein product [Acanthoscelides obtectus]CAK1633145.1 hypothetical protein AOBTE_LOCUS7967 [Acanthoscelides obtectus]
MDKVKMEVGHKPQIEKNFGVKSSRKMPIPTVRFLKKNMSKVSKKITKREYCRWTSEDMDHAINAYK